MDFQFLNEEKIARIQAPVFILHGTADEICPYAMGERLYRKAPDPKDLFAVPDGMHNDLPESAGEAYFDRPFKFLVERRGG